MSNLIDTIFPEIPLATVQRLELLLEHIREWNQKINLISRQDIDHLPNKHLMPSLAFLRAHTFRPDEQVLDVGTGGGFPGLVLAICCPQTRFLLVDSIGKKIQVIQSICQALKIENVLAEHKRVESLKQTFDTVIGRAVTALPTFFRWTAPLLKDQGQLIYLKGGQLENEVQQHQIRPNQTIFLDDILAPLTYPEKYIVVYPALSVKQFANKN